MRQLYGVTCAHIACSCWLWKFSLVITPALTCSCHVRFVSSCCARSKRMTAPRGISAEGSCTRSITGPRLRGLVRVPVIQWGSKDRSVVISLLFVPSSSLTLLSCPLLSYPLLSYPLLYYPIFSYALYSYPLFSYPLLYYPLLSHVSLITLSSHTSLLSSHLVEYIYSWSVERVPSMFVRTKMGTTCTCTMGL